MANPNFGAILDRPSAEVERPKPLPQGSYVCLVHGQPRFDKSSKKQTEFVEFTLKIAQAGDDVDEDDLKEAITRADGSTKPLQEQTIRATYYLTEDALWRLKKFLVDDLQIDEGDKSLRQMIDEAAGHQVLATIKHQPSDDGQGIYAQLGSTAPVE